ncbi:hypothetical protein [Streptomyces caeruleatus]|uniref:Uncharacterized protein n=1 Tax=Streptomyces caeruleatus TaxID=661399 RepID=A0A117RIZ1_9ACTN|nr:hypothetical protein [Streptomyces caeruleatus]KUN93406.1 hypothetical protein AQJ67_38865 [Streptomyces caeruleatus]
MPLTAIVALSLVAVAMFVAYRNERIGSAILVGCGVLAAFYLLLGAPEGNREAPQAPTAPTASITAPDALGGGLTRSDG